MLQADLLYLSLGRYPWKIRTIRRKSRCWSSVMSIRWALILLITGFPASGFACSSVKRAVIDTPKAPAILSTVSTVGFFKARSICPKWAALIPALKASSSWLMCRSFRSSRIRSPSAVAISRYTLTSSLS